MLKHCLYPLLAEEFDPAQDPDVFVTEEEAGDEDWASDEATVEEDELLEEDLEDELLEEDLEDEELQEDEAWQDEPELWGESEFGGEEEPDENSDWE